MPKVHPDLISKLSKRQLVELDACMRCGICVEWCPAVSASKDYKNTPMDKIGTYRKFVQAQHGLLAKLFGARGVEEEELKRFADDLYKSTTCGRCGAVCSAGIHCQELWTDIRALMYEQGYGPIDKINAAGAILEAKHNPYDMPYEDRNKWIPPDAKIAEEAELAFFTGCELAYKAKPMAQGVLKLLNAAKIPFTLFNDEWCCGFPPYILGNRGKEFRAEIEHNVAGLKATGAKRVAAYCPCCLAIMTRTWDEVVELPFEVVHIFVVIVEAVEQGKLKFTKSHEGKVTYHDPCYLSRGWGEGMDIIEQPRKIIKSIPGVELVEMQHNRKLSLCPGSGGGLRRTNLELSHEMSVPVLKEAEATGAKILLTACPAVYERFKMTVEQKIYQPKVKVMDILEFAAQYV